MEWLGIGLFVLLIGAGIGQIFDWIWPPPPRHTHPFPSGVVTHAHTAPKGMEYHTHDEAGNFVPLALPQHHYHHITTPADLGAEVVHIEQEKQHE